MARKLTLTDCNKYAGLKGGKCLSTEYINCRTLMKWKCEHGHEWEAPFYYIKNSKTWCPKCGDISRSEKTTGSKRIFNKITLEDCKKFAEAKGGKCLSTEYFTVKTKMKWECEHGHEWESTFSQLKYNKAWCPICVKKHKHDIELCKKIAIERGGKCLSETYVNNRHNLKWKCECGREWEATLDNIMNRKSWCPICSKKKK